MAACDVPSAGEVGVYIGSQMAAANLQAQAKLALDKTVVGAGGIVTALVSDGPALAGDWLGLATARAVSSPAIVTGSI